MASHVGLAQHDDHDKVDSEHHHSRSNQCLREETRVAAHSGLDQRDDHGKVDSDSIISFHFISFHHASSYTGYGR